MRFEHDAERAGTAVDDRVVGDHSLDTDADAAVEADRAFQESDAGVCAFVGADLCIREPWVVIDRGVGIVVSDPE